MNQEEKQLSEILVNEGYLTQEEIDKASQKQARTHEPLLDILLSEGMITKELLGQSLAEAFGVHFIDLHAHKPSPEMVQLVPEDIAKKYRFVIVSHSENEVVLATDNPHLKDFGNSVQKIFGDKKVTVSYSLPEDIDAALVMYRRELSTRFSQIISNSKRVAPDILEEIIEDAILLNASDVHFDPREKEMVIRFRIDGELFEAGRIDKKYYENLLNRIKVEAKIATDQHYKALDGAIRFETKDHHFADLRVSIVPTFRGEKVTLRVLSEYMRSFSLTDVGLDAKQIETMKNAAKKPFGMIVVAGPTGSGKTTTLYGIVKYLNDPRIHIETIEDPVEYYVDGVNQIQTNESAGMTFADGLRAIVRQDPDIVLVGEVRDHETADIATNAALTGHLLLTSFHANDAATAIPRLFDMGVEPFLLSSTLEIILSQRLVRKICEVCRMSTSFDPNEFSEIFPDWKDYIKPSASVYTGKGCSACEGTGYKGRTGIFEIIVATQEMKDLILRNPSSQQIWELAKKQGATSMFENGMKKVSSGITSVSEVLRVARPSIHNVKY